jgi:hypothetical protein
MNGEPASLVNHDLIAQNLLYLAYSKPITIEHLSREIGIPAAYIEPVVQKLVKGELMRQTGNKVYTDFIISTLEDRGKHITAQKQLVENHFDLFWKAIQAGLDRLRQINYSHVFNHDQRHALELYFVFNPRPSQRRKMDCVWIRQFQEAGLPGTYGHNDACICGRTKGVSQSLSWFKNARLTCL